MRLTLSETTILWLKARTNELEDIYLAGMQAFMGKLWAKLADEAGLEPKFLQCFQALLCKIREAEDTWQDIMELRYHVLGTLIEIIWSN